jgi:hypothetical protein
MLIQVYVNNGKHNLAGLAEMTCRSKWKRNILCSPKNASDLLADVDGGLRVVDEVVHLAVVLALVTLDPQPPAHRRRLLWLHKTRGMYQCCGSGSGIRCGSRIRDG